MSTWGSIRTRTFLLFMVPLLVLIIIGVWLGYQRVVSRTLQASTAEAAAAAQSTASNFASRLSRLAQTATSTALHVSLTEDHDGGLIRTGDDAGYYALLESNVLSDPLIYGAAFGFAPEFLEGRERFAPYVHRDGEGLRRLDIGAVAYDYTLPEWEWYAGPAQDSGPRWTAPYFDTDAGGIVMVTYSAPIRADGRFAGVATVDVPVSALPEQLDIPLPATMRLLVLEDDGTVVWDSVIGDSEDRTPVAELSPPGLDMAWLQTVLSRESGAIELPKGAFAGSGEQALYAPITDTPWTLLAVLDESGILREVRIESALWGLSGLLAFLLVGLIAWRAAGDAARRMERLAAQASALSAGDYSARADERTDELGAVATALNDLADELAVRERALEDAEQKRFAALVNASPMGTLLLSPDGTIEFANVAALDLLAPGERDLVGRTMESLLSSRALKDFPDGLPLAAAGTRLDLGRLELLGPDDEPLMVEADLAGVAGSDGDVLTMVSVRDLRDELRAARTLAERERFLAGIFQNAGVGIVVTDPDGTIRDANVTFREYVGQELTELLGTTFRELLHPDERDEGGRILAALGRGALNGFVTEHRYLREGGALSWGETRSAALRDANDEVERIIVAVTDLTARRRANATFRAVFEHSDDAYLILRRGHVEDANQSALELFGVRGVNELSMPLLSPPFAPEVLPTGQESAEVGPEILERAWAGTTFRGEWAVRRPDATEAPIGVALVPVEIGDDDALLVVAHDLTQRKQFERELVVARDEAESAARAKSDFLATMSHEIRTPMNGVIGMIDLLAQSSLSPDQQRMITTTRDSAFALLAIINDVLDFSKIEAGKLELEQVPVSMHDLIDAVCEMLGKNAGDAGLDLQGLVENDVPDAVLGDSVRLRQILFNLVGNAIKFTRQGRVDIVASRVEREDGAMLQVAVRDTGIGMTQEQIGNLFKPFTQAESSTTRQFGGTGLGLSIVLRLVQLMQGEVVVDSEPGEGSAFIIRIPLQAADPGDSTLPDLTGIRALVCAADSPEREAVRTYLERAGVAFEETDVAGIVPRLSEGPRTDVVYLGSGVDPVDRVRVRGQAESRPAMASTAFVAGMPHGSSLAAPDLPDTTLVPAAPLTRGGLIHAVAVAVGRIDAIATSTDQAPEHALTREDALAAGQLLLVAEDNRTNQEVIRRQLALLGYHADIVDDGLEAIEAMASTTYAALLTDCHMPRVDGFELTHRIREGLDAPGERIPIVAITANAMQGEGERCLAEGMDDYLTKPLELDRLQASLIRWVGLPAAVGSPARAVPSAVARPAPRPAVAATAATRPAAEVEGQAGELPILDSTVLERMLRGDRATARVLMADFVPTARELVDAAVEGLAAGDGSELVRAGHTLKSSARAVGALQLGETCEGLEEAARDGADGPGVADLVGQLQDDFQAAAQAIADELATAEARP